MDNYDWFFCEGIRNEATTPHFYFYDIFNFNYLGCWLTLFKEFLGFVTLSLGNILSLT